VLSNAVFSAVHDGGGQCWESGHLEPFFCAPRHAGSVALHFKHTANPEDRHRQA